MKTLKMLLFFLVWNIRLAFKDIKIKIKAFWRRPAKGGMLFIIIPVGKPFYAAERIGESIAQVMVAMLFTGTFILFYYCVKWLLFGDNIKARLFGNLAIVAFIIALILLLMTKTTFG